MEPRRRIAERPQNEAWELVRKHKVLRGEAKLAWHLLWEQAGGEPAIVATSPIDVAADQGKQDDRSGLRALRALELAGLIEVIDRRNGRWVVHVVEPAELERARRRPHDPQRELPGVEDREHEAAADAAEAAPVRLVIQGGADVEPHPPRPSENLREKEAQRAPLTSAPLPSVTSLPSEGATGSAFGALLINRAAAAAERRPGSGETEAAIAKLVAHISASVNDPQLREAPKLRVATAVVMGQFDQDELRLILGAIETKRRDGTLKRPWWYFVGACQKAFARAGLHWPHKHDG